MKIITEATAGTMESNDIIVRIEPGDKEGIEVFLTSNVMQQYGEQIEKVIRETLAQLGVEKARVEATDKGALDCTVRARTAAAVYRAAQSTDYEWRTGA